MNALELERQALILALRKSTGIDYSVSVEKGLFSLTVVHYNRGAGKPVEVEYIGEALPEAQFMDFLRNFK